MFTPVAAASKQKEFTIKVKTSGAYNITVKNATALPKVYTTNILGMKIDVRNTTHKKSGTTYTFATYLEKNKDYKVDVTYSTKVPLCSHEMNRDQYSTASTKLTRGKIWNYDPNGFQPNSAQGMFTRQIAYLTAGEAAIYASRINDSMYLKLIDTSVTVTEYLAFCQIPEKSALGEFIKEIGKNKFAQIAKQVFAGIATVNLRPNLQESAVAAIKKATNNFKTGLKIVVTNAPGGYYNSYSSWNERASTVYGPEYARGTFTTFSLKNFVGPY